MDVCPAKQWISFLLSLPFPGFPNPNSIPMSFAFWTLRKTLERHVQDPRRLRSKLKERQQTPFTSKLCESTVETHLSPLAGCPVPPGEGNGNPLQHSCLENPMDRGSWQATVSGVTKSQIPLNIHVQSISAYIF